MKRKHSFTIFILTAFILFGAQACFDLEEDISSILTIDELRSEVDIIAALAPMYKDFEDITPKDLQLTGFGADDITTDSKKGNKFPIRVFDSFNYGDGENEDIDLLHKPWNSCWKIIYYANTLIEGLKTSTAPEKAITVGDAEARFWRAYSYYYLVRRWGNVPIILDGQKPTGEETRATVLENYAVIESDLKIAEAGLPSPGETAEIGRASSAAAKAVLANLYLTWAGWPLKDEAKYSLAKAKAKEIIDMNYFTLLPFDELWSEEGGNSRESIFALQFSRAEDIRSRISMENSHAESRGFNDVCPEKQFFYDFPEGLRKEITFDTEIPQRSTVNGILVDKNPPTKSWEKSSLKHPAYRKFYYGADLTYDRPWTFRALQLYRYAEVLLIYAEASAHLNGGSATGEAVEAYNQVKRRAAGLPFDLTDPSVDQTSATVDEIIAEKGWEFAGENKRWDDLVRLEKVSEAIARRASNEEVELIRTAAEITWKQYIAPIPYSTMSTSNFIQNPEGFKIAP